ncbi:MAG: molybdenum cofactor guanylyltransferase [Deltaproteobacteria bacterium]|nr:molybdenum cofactor guanylyltransferase [Deltaproteobacteria bacterium]
MKKHRQLIGCVLIGGESIRMGQPKHLLQYGGQSWLARINSCLQRSCDEVVVVGKGELPDGNWPLLADACGCCGPMAGVLAALRRYPQAALIVCACDMPEISAAAVAWLIGQCQPDDWAVVPQIAGRLHPLFAIYDSRIRPVFEDLAHRNIMRMREVCGARQVRIVEPPLELHNAWRNINDPDELRFWRSGQKPKIG